MGIAEEANGSYDAFSYHSSGPSTKSSRESRKRKADNPPPSSGRPSKGKVTIDLTADSPPATPAKKRKKQQPDGEKRLKVWRKYAPQSYQEIKSRALSQRMFVLDRQRDTSDPQCPTETISMAGTTGNVYTIVVNKRPHCNCPHALKGNQCKHIVYVLSRVLRVTGELEYQFAFLSSELRQIFAQAPPLPSQQADESEKDGNRKSIEGECPICSEDLEPDKSSEEIVWCKAACGNNLHKQCFQQWAATKKGGAVTCPFCRTAWQGDEDTLKKVAKTGRVNAEGYVNVASQLGMSGERDYSTYHPFWVRRQLGYDYY